jgi:hypothetical protein
MVFKLEDLSLEEVLTFEESPYPPTLFETRNILRKTDKLQLAHAIREYTKDFSSEAIMDSIPATDCYALNGGSLLRFLGTKEIRMVPSPSPMLRSHTTPKWREIHF